jgi:voltage-gated potassium channel
MGSVIAADLRTARQTVVIVESDPDLVAEAERQGLPAVKGDANTEETLELAGVARAAALVGTLATDADNLFLTLTARGMNPELNIIVRAEDESNTRKFRQAGASRVVSPYSTGAGHIVRLLTRPEIVDFVELVTQDADIHFEVSQVEVAEDSPFAGKTLAESRVRQATGGMVLAIKRRGGGAIFDPKPDTTIQAGDVLVSVRGI